jgi:ADP-ribose pyrophosphatase YjhB (NUDIX family)
MVIRSYTKDPTYPGPITLNEKPFIPDDSYDIFVRNTVVACTDVAFIPGDERRNVTEQALLLAKRIIEPMRGNWVIGGRIMANDPTDKHSIARCVKRETGLIIDTERFTPVATHLYTWAKVAQGDFPGRNLVVTFSCVLTPQEITEASRGLEKKEYESGFGLRPFTLSAINQIVEKDHGHPMLRDLYFDIFCRR